MFYRIEEDITPVIEAMGFHLVEIATHLNRKVLSVTLFVHKEGGIGSADCETLSLALRPRIEALIHPQELRLSISSPGVNRVLKSQKEYPLFVGKKIRLRLCEGKTLEGVLQSADSLGVRVEDQFYPYGSIAGAKLI